MSLIRPFNMFNCYYVIIIVRNVTFSGLYSPVYCITLSSCCYNNFNPKMSIPFCKQWSLLFYFLHTHPHPKQTNSHHPKHILRLEQIGFECWSSLRANTLSVFCCGWNSSPLSCLDLLPHCLHLEAKRSVPRSRSKARLCREWRQHFDSSRETAELKLTHADMHELINEVGSASRRKLVWRTGDHLQAWFLI